MRYAFDDDDESEMEEQEQQQATQSCSVAARLSQAIPSEHKVTLLLGLHGPGSVLLEALDNTTSVGELVTTVSLEHACADVTGSVTVDKKKTVSTRPRINARRPRRPSCNLQLLRVRRHWSAFLFSRRYRVRTRRPWSDPS